MLGVFFQFSSVFASLYQAYGPMGNALTNNPNTDSGLVNNQEWLLGDMADAIFGGNKSLMGLITESPSNLVSKEKSSKDSETDSEKTKTSGGSSESKKKKKSKSSKSSNSNESESENDE